MLTLRPTGLSSPAYRDWLVYVIVEDGRDVDRLYEDRHSRPELRWFWSITIYFAPKLGITTNGREASLSEAKEQFLRKLAEVPHRLDSCIAPGRIFGLRRGARSEGGRGSDPFRCANLTLEAGYAPAG